MQIKRFSISAKLGLGFGILTISVIISSFMTYITLEQNRKTISDIANIYVPSVSYLQALNHIITDSKLLIKTWVYIDKKDSTPDKIRLQKIHSHGFPELRDTLIEFSKKWSPDSQKMLKDICTNISDTLFEKHKYIMQQLSTFENYNDASVFFEINFLMDEADGEVMILTKSLLENLEHIIKQQEQNVAAGKSLMEASLDKFNRLVVLLGLSLMLLAILLASAITRVIVKPLKILQEAANDLQSGNLDIKVNIKTHDEIENLADAFNQMTVGLKTSSDNLKESNRKLAEERENLEDANQKITSSIQYASRIQNAILPSPKLLEEIIPNSFILYKPKDIVSGDFYFIRKIDNNLLITVADCTGHGVPGAFMSMLGYSLINEIVRRREITQANQVLNHLREAIITSLHQEDKSNETKDGMDIAFCEIDLQTYQMQFAGAYNPMYICRKDNETGDSYQLIELKADKMPIGYFYGQKRSFTNNEFQLIKGDTLYLFSDGYIDQIGGDYGRKFMKARFKEMLLSIQHKTLAEQKEYIDDKLCKWKDKYEQVDDIIVTGFRI